jgi:hypothetical protein
MKDWVRKIDGIDESTIRAILAGVPEERADEGRPEVNLFRQIL